MKYVAETENGVLITILQGIDPPRSLYGATARMILIQSTKILSPIAFLKVAKFKKRIRRQRCL
jgi:hypothetical protein